MRMQPPQFLRGILHRWRPTEHQPHGQLWIRKLPATATSHWETKPSETNSDTQMLKLTTAVLAASSESSPVADRQVLSPGVDIFILFEAYWSTFIDVFLQSSMQAYNKDS
ncbi:hypothetical protein Tco_0205637 [Tanacetum coccineum]